MRRQLTLLAFAALAAGVSFGQGRAFRPPAVPLVVHDPYFSIWSMADRLTDEPTKHWTGAPNTLAGLVRIDGKSYRIMGTDPARTPDELRAPALPQIGVEVLPTRTTYRFAGAGIQLGLTFLTPALPEDLPILSRPVTYLVWEIRSTDGREHSVSLYFDASAELVVNTLQQVVSWSRYRMGDVEVLRMGSRDQPMLQKSGDDLRIDWGYLYVAAPHGPGLSEVAADRRVAWTAFVEKGQLPDSDNLEIDAPARFRMPVLAYSFDLGKVGRAVVSRHLILAYDDLYSIEYFHRRLRPYWHTSRVEVEDLLRNALREYEPLEHRCKTFDEELMADLKRAGGEEYALLCALAYRQTIAAHKLTRDIDGTPLLFSKENFSNGSIDTVDVTYPSSPFFLLFNPELLKAQIRPILDYAGLERWPFPFAPHDLGTYPLANGQTYGGGERSEDRQMPVEESGNMLIMVAALGQIEGTPAFAQKYWPLLTRWAQYLKAKGLDPENQLCTDDFAGHLAHNANLSIKAILALAAYGKLAGMLGRTEEAREYGQTAQEFARQWVGMADDGDHYRLAFDKPGTWSMKYNLVWDNLLGLHLFPPEVVRKEIAYYQTRQNKYGLPLDNRAEYTKLDWLVWTASLAGSEKGFETLFAPAYRFANESPSRVPLTDWYWTQDAKHRGFQARSVVGGIFIKMLNDPAMWKKWAHRSGPRE
jgi:hypothetical protein